MTKADLAASVAEETGMSKKQAAAAVDTIIESIKGAMAKGDSVRLVGFGTFKKLYRKTRKGRNPQTGEQIKIKGRNTITFKASKNFT